MVTIKSKSASAIALARKFTKGEHLQIQIMTKYITAMHKQRTKIYTNRQNIIQSK